MLDAHRCSTTQMNPEMYGSMVNRRLGVRIIKLSLTSEIFKPAAKSNVWLDLALESELDAEVQPDSQCPTLGAQTKERLRRVMFSLESLSRRTRSRQNQQGQSTHQPDK
jgi:hypothetical protein